MARTCIPLLLHRANTCIFSPGFRNHVTAPCYTQPQQPDLVFTAPCKKLHTQSTASFQTSSGPSQLLTKVSPSCIEDCFQPQPLIPPGTFKASMLHGEQLAQTFPHQSPDTQQLFVIFSLLVSPSRKRRYCLCSNWCDSSLSRRGPSGWTGYGLGLRGSLNLM
jgi:hypothetical protein